MQLTKLYLKSDVNLLADVFEKFIKVSVKEFDINPVYFLSLPGFTWQYGLKNTDINLQTLEVKELILTLESNNRGGFSSVLSGRYVVSDENKRSCRLMLVIYLDDNVSAITI